MGKIKNNKNTSQCLNSQLLSSNVVESNTALSRVGTPLFCDLIPSHKCFFKCKMCIDWKTPKDAPMLTLDECKQFIDSLRDFADYKLDINIMGGEPFMIDWLLPLCNYMYSKGFQSIVSTNGYLIDEEMAKKITDSHLGVLAISLDGIKADTHDSIRGTKGAYSQVMDALGYLSKYRNNNIHITILPLILEKNLEELPELVKWARKSKIIDSVSFLALVESGLVNCKKEWFKQPEYRDLWPQDSDKVKEVMDSIICLKKEGCKIVNPFSQLEAFKEYYNDPEKFLRETEYCIYDYIIDLDPTGDMFLSGHPLGSIRGNISLEELWFSKKANEIRRYIDLYGCDNSRSCLINFICAFTRDGDQQSDYYGKMAIYYQAARKYDLALIYFKKALENNPNSVSLHLGAAYNYLKLKDYKAALYEYEEAFKLDPNACKEATILDYKEALRQVKELYNK